GNQNNIRFDPEPERTLSQRRREARRTRQELLEQQLDMAANNNNNEGLDHEDQNTRITFGQYISPTSEGCGSTILSPTIQANNFELKPSLIQLL
ncbi:hypothetical protein PIB30_067447, partial [Stylosanthes scabra]|nr:hypothetical protein [Stylosanthes scabra]